MARKLAESTVNCAIFALLLCLGCSNKLYQAVNHQITLKFSGKIPLSLQEEFAIGASYWRCVDVNIGTDPGGEELHVIKASVDDGAAEYGGDGYIGVDIDKTMKLERLVRITL